MKITQNKKALVGSLAGLALVSGTVLVGVAVANANSASTPASGTTQNEQDEQDGQNEQNDQDGQNDQDEALVKGSIPVPESATEVPDAEESAQLTQLATIDATGAEGAATASVPGSTAISTELSGDDGFLVYDVTVKDGAGAVTEVTVDAGNGTILASEAGDDEGADGGGTDEADEADGAGSQDDNGADGEMNDAADAAQDATHGK
ncbi:PepSY domain-containing protein [Arthrobacter burdickii]|uniref:PepSY domain-containing protein n=1 Tax=Arthrobacter burdickii TaxID=3035920 RepID=A0ABT8JWV7_9MICC|nr:PepSY domain-containing protein [Arthrobacter burdickii]MDN4609559.1 PepSY domain-containing protein [Arthrobacter burdickii]